MAREYGGNFISNFIAVVRGNSIFFFVAKVKRVLFQMYYILIADGYRSMIVIYFP